MEPDVLTRLSILAEDSKYDLSCSCSTNDPREHRRRKLDGTWLYPIQLASGGVGIVLKTLLSNVCSSDCKYCPLRHNGISDRCSLLPDEVATAFMEYHSRLHLYGIFISSGIIGNPDRTMEMLCATAEILRYKYAFHGYIHIKIIPGASKAAIIRAMQLASAVSLNIETPGAKFFRQLSTYKKFETDIIAPIKFLAEQTAKGADYHRIKCTTQFIVGASNETDSDIIRYTDAIYDHLRFRRVYYSAFQPAAPQLFTLDDGTNGLRLNREHRLYQADFLLRKYEFTGNELLFDKNGNLYTDRDPKQVWADAHQEFFPFSVNKSEYRHLLRIPGIGPVYAKRIIAQRKEGRISSWECLGLPESVIVKCKKYAILS